MRDIVRRAGDVAGRGLNAVMAMAQHGETAEEIIIAIAVLVYIGYVALFLV